jgi:hypothetical protein
LFMVSPFGTVSTKGDRTSLSISEIACSCNLPWSLREVTPRGD